MLSGAPTTHSATTKSEYWFYQIIEVMILIPDCVRRRLQEAAEKLPKVWPCGGGKVMLKEECQTICTLCNAMCIVQCALCNVQSLESLESVSSCATTCDLTFVQSFIVQLSPFEFTYVIQCNDHDYWSLKVFD